MYVCVQSNSTRFGNELHEFMDEFTNLCKSRFAAAKAKSQPFAAIVFVFMMKRDAELYSVLKAMCDVQMGISTQPLLLKQIKQVCF
jgi:hypothetical protein